MRSLPLLLVLICTAMAQPPDLKTMSGYPKMVQAQVTSWIEGAAAKMPEEEYGFKPDPERAQATIGWRVSAERASLRMYL